MVVGAGPAGLEAARVASLRGHEVSIWDKDKELGGATRMAMFIKGEENDHLTEYISWFDRMLKKQGVKRHLGKEVTPAVVQAETPDVVILAPGAEAVEPGLPIAKGAHVQTTEEQRKQALESRTDSGRLTSEEKKEIKAEVARQNEGSVFFPTRVDIFGGTVRFFVPREFLGGPAKAEWGYVIGVSGADESGRIDLVKAAGLKKDTPIDPLFIMRAAPGRTDDAAHPKMLAKTNV